MDSPFRDVGDCSASLEPDVYCGVRVKRKEWKDTDEDQWTLGPEPTSLSEKGSRKGPGSTSPVKSLSPMSSLKSPTTSNFTLFT